MTLAQHLVELRKRLMIAAVALIAGMIAAFFLTDPLIWLITEPIRVIAETTGDEAKVELMFTTVTSGFDLRLRMSFAIGLLLSAPVWLWQVWAFVMPGLTRKEIRYTIGFVAAAIPLFVAGCWVGLLIMPHIVELMASFVPNGGAAFFDAAYYYDFVLKLLLVVGVSFVLPVFLVALNLAGVVSGMAILKGWRVAVLVAAVFAAIATPPADIVSMLLLAGILVVLYFAAAGLSLVFDRRRRKRDAAILPPEATA
ncbi:twin-arginine translocase subunit TatC [Microbacterium ulmi]|uniref:Sec-independent protein translocase protein TatC n=1 Tax=Microbacterium ulmi TaxID=179095 RepID=A0A7Y2Q0I4_9MICO|nr:twin-arginine translocase subunit TatC [Microbacterium ulmi]NII70891.1 sec-independent protein translocase protein TatC [Microbacterium ulmi]NNH02905.1 twin-arginine translocase subunit TatC [Microbacterium ulmi]